MSLPKFEYLSPPDVKAACAVLRQYDGQIAVYAGGTELVMHLKRRLKAPRCLLSLKNLTEMRTLRYDPDTGFILGAMCSLKNLAANTHVQSKLKSLAQAASQVASPQIRNMATIGGNICLDTRCWYYDRSKAWRMTFPPCYKAGGDQCHVVKGGKQCYALFQADTVPSLLILKAKLKLVSTEGIRIIPIDEFYTARGEAPNQLSDNELLAEIHIPYLPPYSSSAYIKYRIRDSIEFPVLGVASIVTLDGERKGCQEARFAMVGHSSKPRLTEATEFVVGLEEPVLTEDVIDRILMELKPVHHMGVSASFKRRIARVCVKKAFLEAWTRAQQGEGDPF
jgi:4-hydroxybenzoyl-CoA reductase subunit beta